MRPDIVHTHPYIDSWRAKGYQYYVIPKSMLRTGRLLGLGMDEVALYAVLKDRVSLSYENKWIDEQGRIYIIFTREEASKLLGWSVRKTIDVFARLVAAGLLTETEQKTSGVLKKPKKLYVRRWAEPSMVHSVQELKNGGFVYLTEDTVFTDTSEYYVLPHCLLSDPIYEGLGLRPVLLYVLALDQLHLSIKYGRVDANGLVWCSLDNDVVQDELGCSRNSLYQAYKDLETIGLMTRVRNGSNTKIQYRLYLRDYLSPPHDARALPDMAAGPPGEETGAENGAYQNLHLGPPNSACGESSICIRGSQELHPGPTNLVVPQQQNLHPNHPSYPSSSIPTLSSISIAGGAPSDAPVLREKGIEGNGTHGQTECYWQTVAAVRRQICYEELLEDIRLCMNESWSREAEGLLKKSVDLMASDAIFPGEHIRLGDKLLSKQEVLLCYQGMTRYILYTMLDKVAQRAADIRNTDMYLHSALLHAVKNHEGEAYYTKLDIEAKRSQNQRGPASEGACLWPW